jgi:hypothetical protein
VLNRLDRRQQTTAITRHPSDQGADCEFPGHAVAGCACRLYVGERLSASSATIVVVHAGRCRRWRDSRLAKLHRLVQRLGGSHRRILADAGIDAVFAGIARRLTAHGIRLRLPPGITYVATLVALVEDLQSSLPESARIILQLHRPGMLSRPVGRPPLERWNWGRICPRSSSMSGISGTKGRDKRPGMTSSDASAIVWLASLVTAIARSSRGAAE